MPALSEIKDRINATGDTKKITESLQLVAASKMKGFVKKALLTRKYASSLQSTLASLKNSEDPLPFDKKHTSSDEYHSTAFVLLTSDKGLCGSLNQRLIKFLTDSPKWQNLSKHRRKLVTIGRKGTDAIKRLGYNPLLAYPAIGEDMTPLKSLKIADEIIGLWTSEESIQEILLVSPHYESPFVNYPTFKTFLPFFKNETASPSPENNATYTPEPLLEPSGGRVREMLALQAIESLLTTAFFELKACEYSSRMIAMKKATDSAGELLENLTLEYNKARQSAITRQVAELASAVEAFS